MRFVVSFAVFAAVLAPHPVWAEEGQWMPSQIAELDAATLRKAGLELEPSALWSEDGGLMRAAVNLSGCSAGFVSAEGLVSTNHHCAYKAIQANSSVEHDYLKDGFVAGERGAELDGKGTTVKVLVSVADVTTRVRGAGEGLEPGARARAVGKVKREIVDACEAEDAARTCTVAEFYNGSLYQLHTYLEYPDVRLVYAPPSSVGNFGGEIDNWSWPRHTGDFSLMRVYTGPDGKPAKYAAENVPYKPVQFLAVGSEGVKPGEFVAVLGYPGATDRYLPLVEMRRRVDQFLPARVELFSQWIGILEREGARDAAVGIKVAAKLKTMSNREKNARGMLEGIRRNGLVERREGEEQRMGEWAKKKGEGYEGVLTGLEEVVQSRRDSFASDFLLSNVDTGANALVLAVDLVRWSRERAKADLDRADGFLDRDRDKLWVKQQGRLRDYDAAVDAALIGSFLERVALLPEAARFTKTPAGEAERILKKTKLIDPAVAQATFDAADAAAIAGSKDPLIVLAREIVDAIEAKESADAERDGRMLELGPKYFEMLRAVRTGPVYPDANSTLRLSWATVQGYAPRDGLVATAQTTVGGMIAKYTGVDPFDLPAKVREAAPVASATYWSDPDLGDVPTCFLANADTTGGNSGSPVIDGKGRWVGQNFDRVWENVSGDYGYTTERSRNITVDVRYLLWQLDRIADAGALLQELGVAGLRTAAPRSRTASATGPAAAAAAEAKAPTEDKKGEVGGRRVRAKPLKDAQPKPAAGSCGCRTDSHDPLTMIAMLLLPLALRSRRRRSRPAA